MKQNPPHNKQLIAIAACLVELQGKAPREIKLTPSGTFSAKDGRPGKGLSGWRVNADNAQQIIASANAQQDQLLIDYEHQTLYSRENGQPAPAAAWFKNMQWRNDDGIYATDVQWTATAKAAIESKEYRYISPVLSYNKHTGEVTGILMAALVNYPAIDGLDDLAVAHFNFNSPEDNTVDEKTLALLELDENASQQQITEAITALKSRSDQVDPLQTEVIALKARPEVAPDPAKYVPVETMTALKDQITQLSTQFSDKESSELITAALSDGRLLPAQEEWAKTLDVVALKAYLENAQPIAALSAMQTGGNEPQAQDEDGLTADEVAVCKATGTEIDDFKEAKGDSA